MSQMRKDADRDDDEVKKFISYSNCDPNMAQESSKLSHGSGSPKMGNMSPSSVMVPPDLNKHDVEMQ